MQHMTHSAPQHHPTSITGPLPSHSMLVPNNGGPSPGSLQMFVNGPSAQCNGQQSGPTTPIFTPSSSQNGLTPPQQSQRQTPGKMVSSQHSISLPINGGMQATFNGYNKDVNTPQDIAEKFGSRSGSTTPIPGNIAGVVPSKNIQRSVTPNSNSGCGFPMSSSPPVQNMMPNGMTMHIQSGKFPPGMLAQQQVRSGPNFGPYPGIFPGANAINGASNMMNSQDHASNQFPQNNCSAANASTTQMMLAQSNVLPPNLPATSGGRGRGTTANGTVTGNQRQKKPRAPKNTPNNQQSPTGLTGPAAIASGIPIATSRGGRGSRGPRSGANTNLPRTSVPNMPTGPSLPPGAMLNGPKGMANGPGLMLDQGAYDYPSPGGANCWGPGSLTSPGMLIRGGSNSQDQQVMPGNGLMFGVRAGTMPPNQRPFATQIIPQQRPMMIHNQRPQIGNFPGNQGPMIPSGSFHEPDQMNILNEDPSSRMQLNSNIMQDSIHQNYSMQQSVENMSHGMTTNGGPFYVSQQQQQQQQQSRNQMLSPSAQNSSLPPTGYVNAPSTTIMHHPQPTQHHHSGVPTNHSSVSYAPNSFHSTVSAGIQSPEAPQTTHSSQFVNANAPLSSSDREFQPQVSLSRAAFVNGPSSQNFHPASGQRPNSSTFFSQQSTYGPPSSHQFSQDESRTQASFDRIVSPVLNGHTWGPQQIIIDELIEQPIPRGTIARGYEFEISPMHLQTIVNRNDLEFVISSHLLNEPLQMCQWPLEFFHLRFNEENIPLERLVFNNKPAHRVACVKNLCRPGKNFLEIAISGLGEDPKAPNVINRRRNICNALKSFRFSAFMAHMPVASTFLDSLLRRRTHTIETMCELIASQPPKSPNEQQFPWRKFAELPLICPVFNSRIRIPGRMNGCQHADSFDLEQYLRREALWPRLSCPICGIRCQNGLEGLCIDQTLQSALSLLPSSVSRFFLRADGCWLIPSPPQLNLPQEIDQWQPLIGPQILQMTQALDQLSEETSCRLRRSNSTNTAPSFCSSSAAQSLGNTPIHSQQHQWQSSRPPSVSGENGPWTTPNHASPGPTGTPGTPKTIAGNKTPNKAPVVGSGSFPNIPGVNMTSMSASAGCIKSSTDEISINTVTSRTAQLDYLLSQDTADQHNMPYSCESSLIHPPKLKRTLSGSSSTSTMSATTPAVASSNSTSEQRGIELNSESNGNEVIFSDGSIKRIKMSPISPKSPCNRKRDLVDDLVIPSSASLNDSSTDKFLEDDLFSNTLAHNNNYHGPPSKPSIKKDLSDFVTGAICLKSTDYCQFSREIVESHSLEEFTTDSFLRPDYLAFVISSL